MDEREKVKAVQRMQDYILNNLEKEFTAEQLSRAAGYSTWHALRLFKEYTGKSPMEYKRALRLTEAAKQLRDNKTKVLDVALNANFNSHDGFTKAFSKTFSVTPNEYKREKPAIAYFTHYPITHAYFHMKKRNELRMEERVSRTVMVQVKEKPQRKLIFLRARHEKEYDYMSFCEENGCEWDGLLNSIAEKFDTAAFLKLPCALVKEGQSAYAVGVEVPISYNKPLPTGYNQTDFSKGKALVFQGMPYENEEDFCLAIDIVTEAAQGYIPENFGLKFDFDKGTTFNFGATAKGGAKIELPVTEFILSHK